MHISRIILKFRFQGDRMCGKCCLIFHHPLIFFSDLFLLFWSKIILNVKSLANFLRVFSLNHICDSFAGDVQKSLNVQIVGCQNEMEQCSLVNLQTESIVRSR